MSLEVFHPGDTPLMQITIYKRDGTIMNLTGATVTFEVKKPYGHSPVTWSATVPVPTNGIAQYQVLSSDMGTTEIGLWQVTTKVVSGASQFRSKSPIQFNVEAL